MTGLPLDDLPGYRRRIRIVPGAGCVLCELEDDIHCMAVRVSHNGVTATDIEPIMHRAPWTTCPGAVQQLRDTFTGAPLADFSRRGGKKSNCTHLYDLAQLASAHAADQAVTVYDILVADRDSDGRNSAELRVNGRCLLKFVEHDFSFAAPPELAGSSLLGNMEPWLSAQTPAVQEAAKLLRWGMMVAHGRSIPLDEQSDATRMPPNCFTFQPERAVIAARVGEVKDFSAGGRQPLEGAQSGT